MGVSLSHFFSSFTFSSLGGVGLNMGIVSSVFFVGGRGLVGRSVLGGLLGILFYLLTFYYFHFLFFVSFISYIGWVRLSRG